PSMPADRPPVRDRELPSGPAQGAPPFGKDRSDAAVQPLRTRRSRLFYQIAPCWAPRNVLIPVKSHATAALFPEPQHFWSRDVSAPELCPLPPLPSKSPECPQPVDKRSSDNRPKGGSLVQCGRCPIKLPDRLLLCDPSGAAPALSGF